MERISSQGLCTVRQGSLASGLFAWSLLFLVVSYGKTWVYLLPLLRATSLGEEAPLEKPSLTDWLWTFMKTCAHGGLAFEPLGGSLGGFESWFSCQEVWQVVWPPWGWRQEPGWSDPWGEPVGLGRAGRGHTWPACQGPVFSPSHSSRANKHLWHWSLGTLTLEATWKSPRPVGTNSGCPWIPPAGGIPALPVQPKQVIRPLFFQLASGSQNSEPPVVVTTLRWWSSILSRQSHPASMPSSQVSSWLNNSEGSSTLKLTIKSYQYFQTLTWRSSDTVQLLYCGWQQQPAKVAAVLGEFLSPKVIYLNANTWTAVLEKTLESPLDCKEIKPVNPKGNQRWIFIGRTDAEAEAPVLWPPDSKSWLIGKDPDAGKDWGQEEKGATEDDLVGWHHQLNGHEFKQALGDNEGQGILACCSPWSYKDSDMTERMKNSNS